MTQDLVVLRSCYNNAWTLHLAIENELVRHAQRPSLSLLPKGALLRVVHRHVRLPNVGGIVICKVYPLRQSGV